MRRSGFTIIELLIVIVIIGTVTAFGLPRMNDAVRNESVRSARREVTTQLARAKATAVQRACRSALQIREASGRVWVEACKTTGAGRDTVGAMSNLASKYGVTISTTADSLVFAPNSIGLAPATITMTFTRGT
jgi:prepilin-type N-terminal cleavage/methylation domain-containing protein